jgi:hypothetical protein
MPSKVILIPIDSRPVTFSFPQLVAETAGLEAFTPPLAIMGSLHVPADINQLRAWLEKSLADVKPDALFVCLDSLLYGGLVASRRSGDSLAEVLERVKAIEDWKKLTDGKVQIFAQSSIMRIPHYNTSTTEPPYWLKCGEKIFEWSVLKYKQKIGMSAKESDLSALEEQIPQSALDDFVRRRERNFQVNENLIEMAKSGLIDYLAFSQDDTGEYGLNVWEKTQLLEKAKTIGAANVIAYPGTDETILALMARALIKASPAGPRISVQFSPDEGRRVVSNFEGQTIGASILAIANVIGLDISSAAPKSGDDFTVIIHTSGGGKQGDHLNVAANADLNTAKAVENTVRLLEKAPVPTVLCDVAYSNGADPLLVQALFKRKELLEKLCGYGGWNTTNNTVGSALALGVASWYAKVNGTASENVFKRALFVRFADDWAYQVNVRGKLAGEASDERLDQLMTPFLQQLTKALDFDPGAIALRLPWKRTFEIEIGLRPLETACSSGKN